MNEQFLKRMQGYLQEEYEEYLKTLDEDAYRGLRVNTAKAVCRSVSRLEGMCQPNHPPSVRSPFIIPKRI